MYKMKSIDPEKCNEGGKGILRETSILLKTPQLYAK